MLVAERFIASLMEPYQYEMTTVKLEVAQHQFKMKENIPLQLGYKALFDTTQTEVKKQPSVKGNNIQFHKQI